jgi:hypothetical protein
VKLLRWLGDYWYIPLIAIGAIFGIIWLRGRAPKGVVDKVQAELGAIAAKREARDLQIQLGHEQAKKHVLEKYAEKRKALDAKQDERIKELEDDPAKLALALERLTNS